MNFLAHILLSGSDPAIRFGNFIGDDVKGNKYLNFERKIQIGILLHRRIDAFTDSNDKTLLMLRSIYGKLGKTAGIALDIYSDHFLAKNWKDHSDKTLLQFTEDFYQQMEQFTPLMSHDFSHFFGHMKAGNWLYNYRKQDYLVKTFENMVRKYPFAEKLGAAHEVLVENYEEIERYFTSFFPDLQEDTKETLAFLRE